MTVKKGFRHDTCQKPVTNCQKRFKLSKTVKYCQKLKTCQKMILLIRYSNRQHINRNLLKCSMQNVCQKLLKKWCSSLTMSLKWYQSVETGPIWAYLFTLDANDTNSNIGMYLNRFLTLFDNCHCQKLFLT